MIYSGDRNDLQEVQVKYLNIGDVIYTDLSGSVELYQYVIIDKDNAKGVPSARVDQSQPWQSARLTSDRMEFTVCGDNVFIKVEKQIVGSVKKKKERV